MSLLIVKLMRELRGWMVIQVWGVMVVMMMNLWTEVEDDHDLIDTFQLASVVL